ncbi:MAG: DUF5666 domain-containing protein [Gammaproteobacteria bacterium]|nr:DUF5666 domain-containing protein [Gammaproteobacteria bacterium]
MKRKTLKLTTLAVMTALGLAACNSTQDPTTTQAKTGYLTSGVITGFGSVYINGVEFETDNAAFTVDDATGAESQLKVGMYITLEGDINADGQTGKAAKITFESEIEGMVLENTVSGGVGTLNIMGQTVTVDLDTKFESQLVDVLTIDQLGANNIVEVSGYSSGTGSIYATRIELKKADFTVGEEMELKGVISQLTDATFVIGGMTVNHLSAVLEDFEGVSLADGMYVEVKSTEGLDGNQNLIASKIQLENKDGKGEKREDGEEMEIEGLVTGAVNADLTEVEINGQKVLLREKTEFEHGDASLLLAGTKVEVEGEFDSNGAFIAEEIKFRAEAKIEMDGMLEAVDPAQHTVTVFGQVVSVNNLTVMVDERNSGDIEPVKYFNLSHLAVGDWVQLKAHKDESGNLVANKLERDDAEDANNGVIEVELRGDIDAVQDNGQLLVAGVAVDVSAIDGKSFGVGMEIEMRGTYANGLFTATDVSVEE